MREFKSKKLIITAIKLMICAIISILLVTVIVLLSIRHDDNFEKKPFVAGVVSNGIECGKVGMDVLKRNGTAVDAAIAMLFCEGVAATQSTGLGGGLLATVYIKSLGKTVSINAREVAPKLSDMHMFDNDTSLSKNGGLAIAVPGELKALWEMHKMYGKLEWAELVKPSIELCRNGHIVSKYMATSLRDREARVFAEPTIWEIFVDPKTNRTYEEGQIIKRPVLAKTLEIIAAEGADALYSKNGSLLKTLVQDIQNFGGIITEDDFLSYKVKWSNSISMELDSEHKLFTNPLPSSGPVLVFMLNLLKKFKLQDDSLSYHRVVETFKFGHARKKMLGDDDSPATQLLMEQLLDPSYADLIRSKINDTTTFDEYEYYGAKVNIRDDHGTCHISVLAPNGDAVAVTSTINNVLGSFRRSRSTGIILNDEMDDFSVPNDKSDLAPSPANFVRPGKSPLSSMTPAIVIDKEEYVRLITGGAGGKKITSSVAFIISEHLFKGKSLKTSIDHYRLHHQLEPMVLQWERGFDPDIIKDLENKFHHKMLETKVETGFAAITGLSVINGNIETVSDRRRRGSEEIWISD